jgi:hypothetical protein
MLSAVVSRRVNSGVRHAPHKIGSRVLCDAGQKTDAELNGIINGRSNNSFNRSANSAALIENLNRSALCARPVNSGVSPLNVSYG